MMHAQHALSRLESFELREYQHFQRTKAVNAEAQTFFSLIPRSTAALESHCCWLGKQLDDKERGVTRKRINWIHNWAAISARSRTGRLLKLVINMPPFFHQPIFETLSLDKRLFFELVFTSVSRLWYFHLRSELRVNARFPNARKYFFKAFF